MIFRLFLFALMLLSFTKIYASELEQIYERMQLEQKQKLAEQAENSEIESEYESTIKNPSKLFGVSKKLFSTKEQREIRELSLQQIQLRKQLNDPSKRLRMADGGGNELQAASDRMAEIIEELHNYRIRGVMRDEHERREKLSNSPDEAGLGSTRPFGAKPLQNNGNAARFIDD